MIPLRSRRRSRSTAISARRCTSTMRTRCAAIAGRRTKPRSPTCVWMSSALCPENALLPSRRNRQNSLRPFGEGPMTWGRSSGDERQGGRVVLVGSFWPLLLAIAEVGDPYLLVDTFSPRPRGLESVQPP